MRSLRLSHRVRCRLLFWTSVFLAPTHGHAQAVLSKEYIRLGGQVIAIENIAPYAVLAGSPSFPNQTVGTSGTQTLTLSNTGSAALSVTNIAVNDTDGSNSLTETNSCGATLASGGTCSITITFSPTARQPHFRVPMART